MSLVDNFEKFLISHIQIESSNYGGSNPNIENLKMIGGTLRQAHVIDISHDINNALLIMDNDFKDVLLPYPVMFINMIADLDEYQIKGILVTRASQLLRTLKQPNESWTQEEKNEYSKSIKKTKENDWYQIQSLVYDKKTKNIFMTDLDTTSKKKGYDSTYLSELSKYSTKGDTDIAMNYLQRKLNPLVESYVGSVLKFIMLPEVELIYKGESKQKKKTNNSINSISRSKSYICCTGKTRQYIYDLKNDTNNYSIDKSFIVRGHIRILKHDKYKENMGKVILIHSFVKGKGEIEPKKLLLKSREEQIWASQKELLDIIKTIFPHEYIISNTRSHLEDNLEIDIYVPNLKLGFEYNGEQHYQFPNPFHKTELDFEKQKERDIKKLKIALEKDIKLIVVKFNEPLTKEHIIKRIQS